MKVARSVLTGVLLGAALAFVAALLRPRARSGTSAGYDPTAATGTSGLR